MVRTQLYLPEHLHTTLKEIAEIKKTSLASLMREAAQLVIENEKTVLKHYKKTRFGNLLALSGKHTSKSKDTSANHDSYLFEHM